MSSGVVNTHQLIIFLYHSQLAKLASCGKICIIYCGLTINKKRKERNQSFTLENSSSIFS